eukprot:25960_1
MATVDEKQCNEFTWKLQSDTYKSWVKTAFERISHSKTFKSPQFTLCGAKWFIEFSCIDYVENDAQNTNKEEDDDYYDIDDSSAPKEGFNLKLTCTKLQGNRSDIGVNCHFHFIELDKKYIFSDSFWIKNNNSVGQTHNVLYPSHKYGSSLYDLHTTKQLTIKCVIQETMIIKQNKNNEYIWQIKGKLLEALKQPNNRRCEQHYCSPIFETNNGTYWHCQLLFNLSSKNFTPNLWLKNYSLKLDNIGIKCMFELKEIGKCIQAVGIAHVRGNFMKNDDIIWSVNGDLLQQFKAAKYKQSFKSPYFMSDNAIWYITVYPNGENEQNQGVIYIHQAAAYQRTNQSFYGVRFHVVCNQLKYKSEKYSDHMKWDNNQPEKGQYIVFPTKFKTQQLQNVNDLTIKCNMFIHLKDIGV